MNVRLLAILLVVSSSAFGQAPKPKYFDFHNSFWLNLHHTLFYEASLQALTPEQQKHHGAVPLDSSMLTTQERTVWEKAVAFYGSRYKNRGLLFDDELVDLGNALSRQENAKKLKRTSAIPKEVFAVLKQAAP